MSVFTEADLPAQPAAGAPTAQAANADLKRLLQQRDPAFFSLLRERTRQVLEYDEAWLLSTFRRRAAALNFTDLSGSPQVLRLAVLGGSNLYPLHEIVQHFLACGPGSAIAVELFEGAYDNYVAEIADPASALYAFQPQAIVLIPAERSLKPLDYQAPRERQEEHARRVALDLLALAGSAHERSGAEVVLANFLPPARLDPGPFRSRTLASDWAFRKLVNLELGLRAPAAVRICDVEFLATRQGALQSFDARAWFESKQQYAPDFLVAVAREIAHLLAFRNTPPRKVAVLDLDNTLWGGVVGDDGLDGIEIGATSARGEAFRYFQEHLLSLARRGVLLAVCSKNDHARAVEPFERHPEMVLRMEHFSSFKANWEPKSDNLRQIAAELNVGLDSLVFVDDNAAEIEIVRQFCPEVETILLGPDPAFYAARLQDARLFEPDTVTAEDAIRGEQYRREAQRRELLSATADMPSYLRSLEMTGAISPFRAVDVPRIAQLIQRSNQFNLTTRRRTEAELRLLMADSSFRGLTVRLADRFGDHGLISVVIGRIARPFFVIDTWLMSCRVLKRQVEEEVMNAIVRLAAENGCTTLQGVYLPTPKNDMVRGLYPLMGFTLVEESGGQQRYDLAIDTFRSFETHIHMIHGSHDAS